MLLAAGIMVPAACARVSEDGESFKALGVSYNFFVCTNDNFYITFNFIGRF